MEIGASSSCFYPMETEKAFLHVASHGFRNIEIFLNSPSETENTFFEVQPLSFDSKTSAASIGTNYHAYLEYLPNENTTKTQKRIKK